MIKTYKYKTKINGVEVVLKFQAVSRVHADAQFVNACRELKKASSV